jgi:hypothetical protein
MKTITINVPDDCEVKIIKKEEKTKSIIRTYQDLIDNSVKIIGHYMSRGKIYDYDICCACDDNIGFASSKKVAKSMLAMAMISQLMYFYGREITDTEWKDSRIKKYTLTRNGGNKILKSRAFCDYSFLAFHTSDQRDDFLKYNERLVKDYLMID